MACGCTALAEAFFQQLDCKRALSKGNTHQKAAAGGWEEEEEEGGGFVPLAARSQGSSGLTGLTPFLHVSSHPCAGGKEGAFPATLNCLRSGQPSGEAWPACPAGGVTGAPPPVGVGTRRDIPCAAGGESPGLSVGSAGAVGPSPPSTLGLGEQILDSWQKARLEIQQRWEVLPVCGVWEAPERASSPVLREGHGLAGGCTALELFGFPTLSEAGIYHTGPETNRTPEPELMARDTSACSEPLPGAGTSLPPEDRRVWRRDATSSEGLWEPHAEGLHPKSLVGRAAAASLCGDGKPWWVKGPCIACTLRPASSFLRGAARNFS